MTKNREWWFFHHDPEVFTQNERKGMPWPVESARRKPYLEAGKFLAQDAGIPKGLEHISMSVTHLFGSKRPPDADASAPAAKSLLDGMVLYGVVKDDSGRYVAPIMFEEPMRAVRPDRLGLVIVITETPRTYQEAAHAANS